MSAELFPPDVVEMLSPRLAWLKKHRVLVEVFDWTGTDLEGSDEPRGHAWIDDGRGLRMPGDCLHGDGLGDTEDDAIVDLVKNKGLPLWNEEELSK